MPTGSFVRTYCTRWARQVAMATACAAVMAIGAPSTALAHGGLSMEEDTCVLRVGTHIVHFTGYQPQETDTKEFCEDIPATGRTIVAMDYFDPSMRNIPVEVKILKVVDSGLPDEEQPVEFSLAEAAYPTGTIHFEHDFAKAGRYVGLVTARQDGVEQVGRFPFAVGKGWSSTSQIAFKILGVMALGLALALFLVRRQMTNTARAQSKKARI